MAFTSAPFSIAHLASFSPKRMFTAFHSASVGDGDTAAFSKFSAAEVIETTLLFSGVWYLNTPFIIIVDNTNKNILCQMGTERGLKGISRGTTRDWSMSLDRPIAALL